ncbi:ectoine hydroxylase [Nocardioides albertanoniae]|uniref:Ectoine hydroxylase n=1 Tax=Nocardioides albertanoniae TaxID=1175486 RepID=A0A543A332_9ACTN|nr:ectoine hydroxylase [Nocardioides albertanoniae]TQL66991.1 ectoine hydroxylase [Nocardioides albertanoniae]
MTATIEHANDVYPTRLDGGYGVLPRHDQVVWGTTEDGPMDQQSLESYDENGYLAIPELITPEEVDELRAERQRLCNDPSILNDERTIVETASQEVRSIFEVHKISDVIARLAADPRVAGRARQVLGSDVYIHQSRINFKPGFGGGDFAWHSDFETWHAEDGLPRMRTVSISISLTDNHSYNGPLMIMPGTHRSYVSCGGTTPEDNYKASLMMQGAGVPDTKTLTKMADTYGIDVLAGAAGSAVMFDCNCMHGSNGNITPYPRSNVFLVFNSVENTAVEPFSATKPRPTFIGARDFTPVG